MTLKEKDYTNDEGLKDKSLLLDESEGYGSGICRLCNNYSNSISNDDGVCSDCN